MGEWGNTNFFFIYKHNIGSPRKFLQSCAWRYGMYGKSPIDNISIHVKNIYHEYRKCTADVKKKSFQRSKKVSTWILGSFFFFFKLILFRILLTFCGILFNFISFSKVRTIGRSKTFGRPRRKMSFKEEYFHLLGPP